MINTSKTIIFFGTDNFSGICLSKLLGCGYNIEAVVTKPDSHKGRGRKLTQPIVKTIAQKNGIKVFQPQHTSEISEIISDYDNPIGVLASYGKIIPEQIIDMFKPGIINIHPSLLPKYRGPSPIESAILNGDSETGVTIMKLSKFMDSGDIYCQERHNLSDEEYSSDLYDTLAHKGASLLASELPKIINNQITPKPQDSNLATYCKLLTKSDSLVDPVKLDAHQIERRVRAFDIFPKTKIVFYDKTIIVTKSHVSSQINDVAIECKDNTILSIDELISPNGKKMSALAFINGLK